MLKNFMILKMNINHIVYNTDNNIYGPANLYKVNM